VNASVKAGVQFGLFGRKGTNATGATVDKASPVTSSKGALFAWMKIVRGERMANSSNDGELHVDVVAGGVRVRADLVSLSHQRLGGAGFYPW
jgi:hypothetical protein